MHRPTDREASVRLEVAGCRRVEDKDGLLVRGSRVKKDLDLSGEGLGCDSTSYVAGFPGKIFDKLECLYIVLLLWDLKNKDIAGITFPGSKDKHWEVWPLR